MELGLKGKRALVTGSTRGIGTAIARSLAREGARVVVHGRNRAQTEAVAGELGSGGAELIAVSGRLDTDEGARGVWEGVVAELGGVDILVNNAGRFEVCRWSEADAHRWAETYNIDVLSVVRLVRLCLPGMREAGWGRVIQIASISASIAPPLFPDYAAAKAAIVNLTLSLMQELAGTGVTVNTVSPGPVPTGTWQEFARQIGRENGWGDDLEEIKSRLLKDWMACPGGRFGTPDDIADTVAFVASERAGHLNGVNLPVTGGLAARVS